ncbi:MAG TPA: hypothetical protein VK789_14150 [Bryobacteraceae bacterium]|nr:hypothetical protein [Bryobacteraceae bacterium]
MNTDVSFRIRIARVCALQCVLFTVLGSAQTIPSWKRIAGTTINDGLAGPATGPVDAVWYAAGSRALFARTQSGRIFETNDFVHWRVNTSAAVPTQTNNTTYTPASTPESGVKVQVAAGRLYAESASNVYASEDNGRTWLNLTGFNNRSIIGGDFMALAISTANPQELTAANGFGVWRSLDGGLSWQGLNEDLPNLLVRKLAGRRIVVMADGTEADVNMGSWAPVEGSDPELALRSRFGASMHADVSAAAQAGAVAYAGTADGRLLVSRDNGSTWNEAPGVAGPAVSRIWVDAERPDSALAASGSRLLRTVNGGVFWDQVTGSLPPGQIHGIAADRAAGVVYLATDGGVYMASLSLNDAGAANPAWTPISRDLPPAPAWDVALNADNTLTVALDGYGVFETPAPHRSRTVRLVSGADLTERAAAPGSLVSVLGAHVDTVKNQGVSFPVLAASDESSQVQVPFEAASGTFSLALEGPNDRWTVPLTVKEAAPAIFVDSDGAPLLLDAASGLVLDPKVPVYGGSAVQILATGLGKVTPEWRTGVVAPVDSPPPTVNGTVTAFLDGRPLEVTEAVLAPGYVGYYLVEVQIPSIVNRGANEFRIVMNGEESNRVKLYLEPNSPSH